MAHHNTSPPPPLPARCLSPFAPPAAAAASDASRALHPPPAAAPPHGSPDDRGNRRNARRLQLRHSGFRGTFLHSSTDLTPLRVSPRQSLVLPDASTARDRAFTPRDRGRCTPSPTGILQEISNYATARRTASNSFLNALLNNHPKPTAPAAMQGMASDEENADPDPFAPAAASQSLPKIGSPAPAKHGRRLSLRGTKSVKVLRKSRLSTRSASGETNKYIEHLESQLTAMSTKLDALTSFDSNQSQPARIRMLSRQMHNLQQEVTAWENKFEERVEEQVFERTKIEGTLNIKIQELREELDAKDARALDLQRELDAARQKLAVSERLETDLSRRIDVLTGLLAQSPTRSSVSAASPTIRADSVKRTGRPTSLILPALQTTGLNGLGINTETPTKINRADSYRSQVRGSTLPSPRGQWQDWTAQSPSSPTTDVRRSFLLENDEQLEGFDLLGLDGSRLASESTSLQSAPSTRPTSIMSNSSLWSTWGVPPAPELTLKRDPQSRRMRRFVNSGTALKPLLLPSSSVTNDDSASPSPNRRTASPIRNRGSVQFGCPDGSLQCPDRERSLSLDILPMHEVTDTGLNDHPQDGFPWQSSRLSNQHEDAFYRQYSPSPRTMTDARAGEASPTMASSPLILYDPTQDAKARSNVSTPIKQCRLSEEISRASSSGARTLRICTPSTNLDTLLMDETPSKSAMTSSPTEANEGNSDSGNSTALAKCVQHASLACILPTWPLSSALGQCLNRITRMVLSLRRSTLLGIRALLLRAWIRGSSGFGALGWWLFGRIQPLQPVGHSLVGSMPAKGTGERPSTAASAPRSSTAEGFMGLPWSGMFVSNAERAEVPPRSHRTCLECVEPRLRRNLRLWCRLSLTIVLAVGIAIIHGPGILLDEHNEPKHVDKRLGGDDAT